MDWYCLKSKPKSEHLAAAHLERVGGIEVFCPRVKFEKATRRGKVWFIEALFPGYLFARFDFETQFRLVQSTNSVTGIVHFAENYPILSDSFIEEIRAEFSNEEPRILEGEIQEGDEVLIADGAMEGLTVLVTKVMPGRDRVRILLEWLGQEREAEVKMQSVVRSGDARG